MIALIDRQTRKLKWEHRDDSFGMQHDCEPLANGNVTLFANGTNIITNPYSRVIEIDPRTHKTVWEYRGKPNYTFFSPHISGAQRLASGNTLICEGQWGRLFEVTPDGEIVWEYVSPFMGPDRFGDPSNEVFRAYRYGARLATASRAGQIDLCLISQREVRNPRRRIVSDTATHAPATPDERLAAVRRDIAIAARDARRDPAAVTLVAISKTFGVEAIAPVIAAGQRVFGENRVQEAKTKWPALKEQHPDIELHLVGPAAIEQGA